MLRVAFLLSAASRLAPSKSGPGFSTGASGWVLRSTDTVAVGAVVGVVCAQRISQLSDALTVALDEPQWLCYPFAPLRLQCSGVGILQASPVRGGYAGIGDQYKQNAAMNPH